MIYELIGIDFCFVDDFFLDDVGNGFDNIGDVLMMFFLLVEKYLVVVEEIVDWVFEDEMGRVMIIICEFVNDMECFVCVKCIICNFVRWVYWWLVIEEEFEWFFELGF